MDTFTRLILSTQPCFFFGLDRSVGPAVVSHDREIGFHLTPQSHRPYNSQISQLGSHLGPSRTVPDLKMHAGMLLDAYFDPPDPYMTFLDLGGKVDF